MEGTYRQEEIGGRRLTLYTPMSYGEEGRRFPVVYLQDNGEVMEHSLNYLEHLFITKELPELIFVGITPRDRNHEYTPWPSISPDAGQTGFWRWRWRVFGGTCREDQAVCRQQLSYFARTRAYGAAWLLLRRTDLALWILPLSRCVWQDRADFRIILV